MVKCEWILKRNCSMSPRQLVVAYSWLCAASLSVATFHALRGAWVVLAFAAAELLAVGVAFFLYARHASDRERIALIDDCLLVEVVQMERVRQYRLDARWTRVEPPGRGSKLILLTARGTKVEVGRFLTEWKRREFAKELTRALASEK